MSGCLHNSPMRVPDLERLVTLSMPFGKYKGRLIADLPGHYLNWFAREGAGRENVNAVSADLVAMSEAAQPADVLWLHLFYHSRSNDGFRVRSGHIRQRRPRSDARCARFQRPCRLEVVSDPGFSAPLRADLMHVEAASLPGSGPQTASWFQGWRYSSPHIRVGVCRGHHRAFQPAYVNPQLACWRVCCVAFAH